MLLVDNLAASYGQIRALRGVSLTVAQGQIVTLIGSNGAGKTTLLRSLVGVHRQVSGRLEFMGRDITALRAHQRVEMGLVLVPEGRGILPDMNVYENLLMGAYTRHDRAEIAADVERMYERFPILAERRQQIAGTLSGGQQQILAIARALMARPRLLMLDEPSLGLAPQVVADVFRIIQALQSEGLTVLLVEQNARKALKIAQHGYVLETGEIVRTGPTAELAQDPVVRRAYLGIV